MTARRYNQCDSTCTVDCGHCKGKGKPVGSPDPISDEAVSVAIEWGWHGNGGREPYNTGEGKSGRAAAESGVHDWRRDGYPDTHLVARSCGPWVRIPDDTDSAALLLAQPVVERLRAELDDAELRCANALADVLAQDAELAKRDARLTRLADALAEVVTELAALRSAGQTGGQGEPSDDGWGICEHGVMGSHDFAEDTEWGVNHHYCPGKRLAAAAVPVDYPRCAIEGCDKRVTCGSPAPNGYVSCCSIDHAQALGGFPDWPVRPAAAAKAAT